MSQVLQERADKICEMANVMQKSIQIDEENMAKEQELMARLVTENKVSPFFIYSLRVWHGFKVLLCPGNEQLLN